MKFIDSRGFRHFRCDHCGEEYCFQPGTTDTLEDRGHGEKCWVLKNDDTTHLVSHGFLKQVFVLLARNEWTDTDWGEACMDCSGQGQSWEKRFDRDRGYEFKRIHDPSCMYDSIVKELERATGGTRDVVHGTRNPGE